MGVPCFRRVVSGMGVRERVADAGRWQRQSMATGTTATPVVHGAWLGTRCHHASHVVERPRSARRIGLPRVHVDSAGKPMDADPPGGGYVGAASPGA